MDVLNENDSNNYNYINETNIYLDYKELKQKYFTVTLLIHLNHVLIVSV